MNCAITGSRGVLGRKFISLYNKKINFIEYKGDITNRKKIINWIIKKNFDYFLHFAAIVPTKVVDKNYNLSKKVNYHGTKNIIDGLKKGYALGITPDGPRGPNQQINGELLNIARLTNSCIIAISYSSSNFKIIKKSWDKFKIPLPFSKLCFVVDEIYFEIKKEDKNAEEIFDKQKNAITERLNFVQKKCDNFVQRNYDNLN